MNCGQLTNIVNSIKYVNLALIDTSYCNLIEKEINYEFV